LPQHFQQKMHAGFEQWLENARRSDSNVETKIELLRKGKEQGYYEKERSKDFKPQLGMENWKVR